MFTKHKDYFHFFNSKNEQALLNMAIWGENQGKVEANREVLTNDLLELIRGGYGLTGVYRKDIDLLYRLKILEDVLEHKYLLFKTDTPNDPILKDRGFVFDYEDAPYYIKDNVVWRYFLDFKRESPFYKKFSFLCNGAFLFTMFYAANKYWHPLPYLPEGRGLCGAGVREARGRKDLDPDTILTEGLSVYFNFKHLPPNSEPMIYKPMYLKIKGYRGYLDESKPIYYKGPLKRLQVEQYRVGGDIRFRFQSKAKPKAPPLPYFIYESLYNEGEFL